MKKILNIAIIIIPICIFITTLLPGGILYRTELGHLVSKIYNFNRIQVIATDSEILENLKIGWIKPDSKKEVIVFEGENINNIESQYGVHQFNIYYKNSLIKKYEQFFTNNWHYYDYTVKVSKVKDKLIVEMKSKGPEPNVIDITDDNENR